MSVLDRYRLNGAVALITGGAGLLGGEHARAVAEGGGIPVLLDLDDRGARRVAEEVTRETGAQALGLEADVTSSASVQAALAETIQQFGRVDILVNNAANNPKFEATASGSQWARLESFPLAEWERDVAVGLTGAFICSQLVGTQLAEQGHGVILNIASDLALIGPDQRVYRQPALPDEEQPTKPVSYPVVKAGLLGLTRYLATYWAESGVRVNALAPGGVRSDQSDEFVRRLTDLIPLGRMAERDEYRAAVLFLVSDASSYITGATLVADGGRTAW